MKINRLYTKIISLSILTNIVITNIVFAGCPHWSRGNRFSTGDIVEYNGENYVADSYNQAERKWMWRPTNQSCDVDSSSTNVSSNNYCGDPWVEGQWYNFDDEVEYGGVNYVAVQGNPGYNPTIKTWFWEPTSKSCGKAVNSIHTTISSRIDHRYR